MKVIGRKQKKELAAAIDRGRRLLAEHRHQEAFELLRDKVEQFPEDPEVRLLYASTLLAVQPENVVSEATKAVELGPAEPAILIRAAHLMLNRGETERARSVLDRTNELAQPDFVLMSALDNLNGLIAFLDGDFALAEEKLRSAVKRDPANGPFARKLAVFLAEQGRLSEAVAVLDEALKHVEDKPDLEHLRAQMASV